MRYLVEGVYNGLKSAMMQLGDTVQVTHGYTGSQPTYEAVRFQVNFSGDAGYLSCERTQAYSFILNAFSLNDQTALQRIDAAVQWFENNRINTPANEETVVVFRLGPRMLVEDPEKTEDGNTIRNASAILMFDISDTR